MVTKKLLLISRIQHSETAPYFRCIKLLQRKSLGWLITLAVLHRAGWGPGGGSSSNTIEYLMQFLCPTR